MTPISALVSIWPCLPQINRRHGSKYLQLPAIKLTYLHLYFFPCSFPLQDPEQKPFILLKSGSHPFLVFQECYFIHLSLPTGCTPWAHGQGTAYNLQVLLRIPHSLISVTEKFLSSILNISFSSPSIPSSGLCIWLSNLYTLNPRLKNQPIISLFQIACALFAFHLAWLFSWLIPLAAHSTVFAWLLGHGFLFIPLAVSLVLLFLVWGHHGSCFNLPGWSHPLSR